MSGKENKNCQFRVLVQEGERKKWQVKVRSLMIETRKGLHLLIYIEWLSDSVKLIPAAMVTNKAT
jgi:hypothetical protein